MGAKEWLGGTSREEMGVFWMPGRTDIGGHPRMQRRGEEGRVERWNFTN